jgi:hypothetical protein
MDTRALVGDLKQVRLDLEAIVEAMQAEEHPGMEGCGIAFVCAEAALEIVNRLELDLGDEMYDARHGVALPGLSVSPNTTGAP